MEDTERNRLRESLNFPDPTPDAPVFVPSRLPEPEDAREIEVDAVSDAAPEVVPVAESAREASTPAPQLGEITAALAQLTEAAELLDAQLQGTRRDIERLHERLDRIESAPPVVDELAGIEAVRRTVAASHRALASQLARMFDDLEVKLRRGGPDDVLVGAGSRDR